MNSRVTDVFAIIIVIKPKKRCALAINTSEKLKSYIALPVVRINSHDSCLKVELVSGIMR